MSLGTKPLVIALLVALAIALGTIFVLANGRASTDAAAPDLEANKAVVTNFLNALANERDVDKALLLMDENYIQHNPGMPTGREASRVAFTGMMAAMPYTRIEIKRVLAEGDMVLAHSWGQRYEGDRGIALMDLFRIRDGKIVEHWDVIQDVPDPATAKNTNSMF